jgi:endonuclease-3
MAESRAAKQARARRILGLLARAYPDAKIALSFSTPFELLVATILSAQCTDERVNMVTPGLFRKYPTARALARARPPSLEKEIRSTGFFRAKARSLLGMARALVERHGGEVPEDLTELVELPGVGLKTANVVLGNAFGRQALAVDTHVFRVSQRLGLARSDDPDEIHDQLVAALPREALTQATHLLITHGRRTCAARKPACPGCPVRELCRWPERTGAPARLEGNPRRVPRSPSGLQGNPRRVPRSPS